MRNSRRQESISLCPICMRKMSRSTTRGSIRLTGAKYLFLEIAHIVGDGMTLKILFEDLNDLYAGKPVEKEKYTLFEYVLDEKARDGKGKREQVSHTTES